MNTFDFIPQNDERTQADITIVALFLRAIMKKGHYETYPQWGIRHHLTADGEFRTGDCGGAKTVRLMPCDIEYAWQVLREKGYHVRKDGSMYCVDKTKWATSTDRVGYYMF
jgi:hypothetical protein